MRYKRWGDLHNGFRTSGLHVFSDMSLGVTQSDCTAVCDHKSYEGFSSIETGGMLWPGWNASCSSAEVWR
jgi:hypothetical protein